MPEIELSIDSATGKWPGLKNLKPGEPYNIILKLPTVQRVRLVGLLFNTNKCFLLPQGLPGIKKIIETHQKCTGTQVLIVGHADSNEDLAGCDMALDRADILSAYLSNKPDVWLSWFSTKKETKVRWGTREVQLMLSSLPDGQEPFYKGSAPGVTDSTTVKAIKDFQKYSNEKFRTKLVTDGIAGPETRNALVKAYMDIEDTTLSDDIVPVTHGCEGHFDDVVTKEGVPPDDRRLEVFFFKKEISPAPEENTSSEGTSHYYEWTKKVKATFDFEYHAMHIQIVDSKKKPVPFANVKISGPTSHDAVTDEYGYITISGVKTGEYAVHSEKKGYKIGDSKITYPTVKTVPGCIADGKSSRK
jgi:hypothetical protein